MPQKRLWVRRALAVGLGLALGLAIAECGLRVASLPHFYKAHSTPSQFTFLKDGETGRYFYVNKLSTAITFKYDSNPRGYFQPGNLVVQNTNSDGLRGPEFSLVKPAKTLRLFFFGDSFTFGEGVRFEDTFPEVTGKLLASRFAPEKVGFQCYNCGVGGYNTANELFLLKRMASRARPDVVVLCYCLNDAEPPLYTVDPVGGPVRRFREADIPEGLDQPTPPDRLLYRLRISQLVWQFAAARQRNRQTEAYYRGLYRSDAEGWKATRKALDETVSFCQERRIPLVVMLYPLLYRLDAGHPFRDIFAKVAEEVEGHGGHVLNLLPAFQGKSAEKLWVHPTDQHPNEVADRIAATALAAYLASRQDIRDLIAAAARGP